MNRAGCAENAGPADRRRLIHGAEEASSPGLGLLLLTADGAIHGGAVVIGPTDAECLLPVVLITAERQAELLAEARPAPPIGADLADAIRKLGHVLAGWTAHEPCVLEWKNLRLDSASGVAEADGRALDLTRREQELLELFLRAPGRLLTRQDIAMAIWRSESAPTHNLIEVHMSRLRIKLEAALGRPVFKTLRGRGYRLV